MRSLVFQFVSANDYLVKCGIPMRDRTRGRLERRFLRRAGLC